METPSGSRARDRLGRPLRGPDRLKDSYPQVPERTEVTGETAWLEAVEYLNHNLPFHVHEVCEQRWRCSPDSERSAWRALAQWGAALTHQARGNPVGALSLAERSTETLDSAGYIPDYIDLNLVRSSLAELLT